MWGWVSNKTTSIKSAAKNYVTKASTSYLEKEDFDQEITPYQETIQAPLFKRISEVDLLDWDMNAHFGYLTLDFIGQSEELQCDFIFPLISDQRSWVLHRAAFENNLDQLREYLSWGCFDVNSPDKHGNTPLHHAIFNNNLTMVRLLLAYGANTGAKNKLGWKCLGEAVSMGNRDIILALATNFKLRSSKAFEERAPIVLRHLRNIGLDDFKLSIDWSFSSWVPFVSSLLPNDTYHIYKKVFSDGSVRLRVDTTLIDFNNMSWKRGNISFLWVSNGLDPFRENRPQNFSDGTSFGTNSGQPDVNLLDKKYGAGLFVLDHIAKTYRMLARLERAANGGFTFVRSGRSDFSQASLKLTNLVAQTKKKAKTLRHKLSLAEVDNFFDCVGFPAGSKVLSKIREKQKEKQKEKQTQKLQAEAEAEAETEAENNEIVDLITQHGLLMGLSEWVKREDVRDSIDSLLREPLSTYSNPGDLEFIRSKSGFWKKQDRVDDDIWLSAVYDVPTIDILSKKRTEFIAPEFVSNLSLMNFSSSALKADLIRRKMLKHTRYFLLANIKRRVAYRHWLENVDPIQAETLTSPSNSGFVQYPVRGFIPPGDENVDPIMYSINITTLQERIRAEINAGNDDDSLSELINNQQPGQEDQEIDQDQEKLSNESDNDDFADLTQDIHDLPPSSPSAPRSDEDHQSFKELPEENNNNRLLNIVKVLANRHDAFDLHEFLKFQPSTSTSTQLPLVLTSPEIDALAFLSTQHILPQPFDSTNSANSEKSDFTTKPTTFDQYLAISERSQRSHLGRPMKVQEKTRKFSARVSMTDQFPISIQSVISILDAVMPSHKAPQLEKMKEFVSKRLPPGFPVKISLPVFPTIVAEISFGKFHVNALDPEVFEIPDDYTMDLATQSQWG